MAASTPNLIKQANLKRIRSALLQQQSATKPQLAEHTGLSVITVNTLIRSLLESGEVVEDHVVHPQLGRPAMAYRLNETYCLALIVYTFEKDGQDTAFFVVRNLYGNSVEKFEKPIADIGPNSFDREISALLEKYPSIRLIGFGLPVTESNGTIISSDYPHLVGRKFCAEKEALFHLPVFLVNDIKSATVGYCHNHAISPEHCVIGLYLPYKYAPGIAIYQDSKLVYGRDGLAGRIASLVPAIQWDTCDYQEKSYQDAVLQIIHTISCLYNPYAIVIYSEMPMEFLSTRINEFFLSPVDQIILPQLTVLNTIEQDFRSGMTHLALDTLFRLEFPIHVSE
ncbi:MAG: ROK family transcriptional regulator [Oscillibacter sp.]|nr:ROK family transcriptional regulator [Oscillibacter sp.]